MATPYDVAYDAINVEIIPANLFNSGWPDNSIRLKVDPSDGINYLPLLVMLGSFVVYWFFLVPVLFVKTKPSNEKEQNDVIPYRDAHNFTLFLYSGFCCISTFVWLIVDGQVTGNFQADWHSVFCTPVEGTWLRALSFTFTISKIWEWLDSLFLIWLSPRPPLFLHKYHHATTFWLFCVVPNMPGPEKFGLLLNGGVHTLMYNHYWRPWPKGSASVITVLQIVQLAFVTYAWTVNPAECPNAKFAYNFDKNDYGQWAVFLTPYVMVPVYLYFFVVFFFDKFVFKKSGSNSSKKKD